MGGRKNIANKKRNLQGFFLLANPHCPAGSDPRGPTLKWYSMRITNRKRGLNLLKFGAGEESRTLDLNLGKVALYQLSYSRGEAKL